MAHVAAGDEQSIATPSADPDRPLLQQEDTESATAVGAVGAVGGPTGEPLSGPFGARQLWRIDEALSNADREGGLTFSVFVGDLDEPTRASAERLHEQIPGQESAVLLAVAPNQRVLEIVTGARAAVLVPDRVCALASLSMTAAFEGGDLTSGIVTGLRMLADAAAVG